MKNFKSLREKKLTPAELKKREEIAKAMERENPGMPMAKKMAIATATAKKVAEAAPKMKGDWLKKERERNREHDAAMGRTPTGRKKPVRQMTSTQRSLASMRKESVNEAADPQMDKIKQLVRLGLMDKADMAKIVRALNMMKDGKTVPPAERGILFDMLNELIGMITGDQAMFQKARKAVREAYEDDEPASPDEAGMAMSQLKFICYAANEVMENIQEGAAFPEWFQNKLTSNYESMKDLYAYMEGENENDEDA